MTDFWIASLLLSALALGVMLWPLRQSRRVTVSDEGGLSREQLIEVGKDRLRELKGELDAGRLSAEEFAGLRAETEATLWRDLQAPASVTARQGLGGRTAWGLAAVSGLLAVLVSYGLYAHWGAYSDVAQARLNQDTRETMAMGDEPLEDLVGQLQSRLEAESTPNPDGWALLGRTLFNMERYNEAGDAFERLAQILTEQQQDASPVWGMVAQARFFATRGRATPAVMDAIARAQAINPDEMSSLGLLGIISFESGKYADAKTYWQRMLVLAPNHPQAESIREGIRRAESFVSEGGAAADGSVAAADIPSLEVTVHIAPELAAQVSSGDSLFVFAKAVTGPPMPLAVSRLAASGFPLKVVLDDSMAMAPGLKLSSFPEVTVMARISRSGDPIAAPGDLEGVVTPIAWGQKRNKINVVIDQVVK